jgi:hypothetical protein
MKFRCEVAERLQHLQENERLQHGWLRQEEMRVRENEGAREKGR